MKTVNVKTEPKADCWAYKNGDYSILKECCCALGVKCGHYKTWAEHLESNRKAAMRRKELGKKNNRVSGN